MEDLIVMLFSLEESITKDIIVMLLSLGFKLTSAIVAYIVLLLIDRHLQMRYGVFQSTLMDADPTAQAIYLGARRLASAVLVGLCVG